MVCRPGLALAFLPVFLASFSSPAHAQPEQYEGRRIATIQFVPREQPLEAATIFRILPIRTGDLLNLRDLRDAIRRLYATGVYTDIQIDAELFGDDGVIVRFLTEPSWFVGEVLVESSLREPPNTGQLVNATGLQLGELFRSGRLLQAVDGLQQVLESNGYHETRIEPRFEYHDRTHQVSIRFLVESGSRARLTTPEITGELKADPQELIRATKYRNWLLGWRPATQTRTQRGVENIRGFYLKQDRLMAGVSLAGIHYDPETHRQQPRIDVQAGPRVEIRTFGAKVSRSVLRRYVPIFDERTVDRDLLEEGKRNLRDYFQSRGYFDAEVEFKQQRIVNDRAQIDYLINLGRRYKLTRVEVEGNRYFDDETIRERIFLLPASLQFRYGRYSESFLRRDQQTIVNLYRENGFLDVKVTTEVTTVTSGKDNLIEAVFRIEEGPQWFISSLEMDGVNRLDQEDLRQSLGSQPGQPYSEYTIAVDRDHILSRYFQEGFPDATFAWIALPDETPNRMRLRFVVYEGEQRFVRQVLISGLDTTRPSLINRNLLLNPGDPLSQIRMSETQQRLYDLGIFARVNMAIQNPTGETPEKYVLYQMEEANRYSLTGGLGAELGRIGGGQRSFANPGGAAGFSPRVSLNLSRLNFLGLGQTVSFRSRLSNLQRRGLMNYTIPRVREYDNLGVTFTGLYDDSNDVRTFSLRRREAIAQLSQRMSRSNTLFYRFSARRVSVANLKIDPLLVPRLAQPVRIGMLSGTLIQDRRDDPTDAQRGTYNTFDLGVAADYFGSEATFARFLGRNSTYHRLSRRILLARSLSIGWIYNGRFDRRPFTFDDETGAPNAVPLAERFFSGGANSHRAFPENQAGPRDLTTGFPLGGKALVMNNIEFRFPVIGDTVAAVLFHDAGNIYSDVNRISVRFRQKGLDDFDYAVHALGIGLRYRTPVGPLRLDLSYSPNSPRFFGCSNLDILGGCGDQLTQRMRQFQFHFSIGQAF
ncbi:MAG: BamA/TamA family outer membrane protein [Bryobacterales bacterium]|nr:BamA/TamA family outer membrane protein [Bryobacterales bacterium]